jgi:hypothetical protein
MSEHKWETQRRPKDFWDQNMASKHVFLFGNMFPARCKKINPERFLLRPIFCTKFDPKHDACVPKIHPKMYHFWQEFSTPKHGENKAISLFGFQTQVFYCVKNTTVYSCGNLDAKRYHFKSTKRGQKGYRFQRMFQGGLTIAQRERHVWMLCFWSKNPSAAAVRCVFDHPFDRCTAAQLVLLPIVGISIICWGYFAAAAVRCRVTAASPTLSSRRPTVRQPHDIVYSHQIKQNLDLGQDVSWE